MIAGVLKVIFDRFRDSDRSEVGSDGLPSDAYFQRRSAIYQKGQVQRRYIPTDEIAGAILSYRTHAPVQYIESRKFYCCAYTKAVVETESYQFLENLCEDGYLATILGCDCPERIGIYGMVHRDDQAFYFQSFGE